MAKTRKIAATAAQAATEAATKRTAKPARATPAIRTGTDSLSDESHNFAMTSKPTTRSWSGRGSSPRRALVGEFVVCSVILALSPLSSKHKDDSAGQWMARGAAISAFFLVLALTATASDKAGRVAAATGAVVTVALAVNDHDVFANLLGAISRRRGTPTATGEQSDTGVPMPASAELGGPVTQAPGAANLGGPVG